MKNDVIVVVIYAKGRLNCFAVRALNDAIKAIVVRKVAEGSGLGMP